MKVKAKKLKPLKKKAGRNILLGALSISTLFSLASCQSRRRLAGDIQVIDEHNGSNGNEIVPLPGEEPVDIERIEQLRGEMPVEGFDDPIEE